MSLFLRRRTRTSQVGVVVVLEMLVVLSRLVSNGLFSNNAVADATEDYTQDRKQGCGKEQPLERFAGGRSGAAAFGSMKLTS